MHEELTILVEHSRPPNSYCYYMAFGQHEYQHRFYRNEPHKKLVGLTPFDSRVLPLSYPHPQQQFYTPQPPRHPEGNALNLRVRAGEMGYNQPGWEGYRLKSYVTDKYGQNYRNYQNDRDTIEKFRQEALEHKRRLRFGAPNLYQQYTPPLLPEIRMKTEPPQPVEHQYPEPPFEQQNPEREEIDRYDVGVMARLQSRQQDYARSAAAEQKQQERQERQERRRLKEYRRKYSKLKNRLKEELNLRREEESIDHRDGNNMSRIERLITDVSDRIAKNTIIFNEGLRVEKQLREMRDKERSPSPGLVESKVTIAQRRPPSVVEYSPQLLESKPATPKVVYNQRRLSDSYDQLQHLRNEITSINDRIGKKYRQL